MARAKYGNSVIYKFLIHKIRGLVKDSRGRLKYATYFDNIIYDIFGVKHFTRKMDESYADRDFVEVLEMVGSDQLMKIMNNAKFYDAMRELIAINYRINTLRKDIRKQGKKDKRNKSDLKEYKYLTNLYEDSIKYFRKKLGIKNSKNSYKRRYKSLSNIVREEYDYDDEYTSVLLRSGDDDYYFDNDDDDDYDDFDDYESTSELEDFVNRMNGKSDRRSSRRDKRDSVSYRPKRYSNDDFDLDEEEDFEDDDDDYDDRHSRRSSIPSMEDPAIKQLNKLTEVVSDLSGAVQALMNKNEYDTVQRRKEMYQNHYSGNLSEDDLRPSAGRDMVSDSVDTHKELEIITEFIGRLSDEQNKMKLNQKTIAEALDKVVHQQENIIAFLNTFGEDDEDYEDDISEDVVMRSPVVAENSELSQKINKYPDIYEEMANDDDLPEGKMRVEELIDTINGSDEATVEAVKETKVEKVAVKTSTPQKPSVNPKHRR